MNILHESTGSVKIHTQLGCELFQNLWEIPQLTPDIENLVWKLIADRRKE